MYLTNSMRREVDTRSGSRSVTRLDAADDIKKAWRAGQVPSAAHALRDHPEFAPNRSLVLDLIYDEYCFRTMSGEAIHAEEFANTFPSYKESVLRLIEVHHYFDCLPSQTRVGLWPEPGDVLAGFHLIECLGEGGAGKAYLAEDLSLASRLVVIKLSRLGCAEAEIMAKLRHAQIIPIHTVQTLPDRGLSVLCMPYLGRATLADLIAALFSRGRPERAAEIASLLQRLNVDERIPSANDRLQTRGRYIDAVIELGAQIAAALAHAHALEISHGDIKPSNILIGFDGKPMLMDFNLSADKGDPAYLGGTLAYMPPEQLVAFTGERACLNSGQRLRGDVFSLGVVLYELLTGALPFPQSNKPKSTAQAALQLLALQCDGCVPIAAHNPEIDSSLAKFVERCLSADLHNRPADAEEVFQELNRQRTFWSWCRRSSRRHRRALVGASGASICCIVVTLLYHASLPSYPERQFERASEAYVRTDYSTALEALDAALRGDPYYANAYFLRGKILIHQNQFEAALRDFQCARKAYPDARAYAEQGYCYAMLGNHRNALYFFNESLKRGFESAELYNDIGYSHSQLSEFERAQEYYNRALALSPELTPVLHNRAQTVLRRAMQFSQPVPESSCQDIEKVIATDHPPADAFVDAARIFCYAGRYREAIVHLRSAVRQGADPKRLVKDPAFRVLDLQELATVRASKHQSTAADHYLDPVSSYTLILPNSFTAKRQVTSGDQHRLE